MISSIEWRFCSFEWFIKIEIFNFKIRVQWIKVEKVCFWNMHITCFHMGLILYSDHQSALFCFHWSDNATQSLEYINKKYAVEYRYIFGSLHFYSTISMNIHKTTYKLCISFNNGIPMQIKFTVYFEKIRFLFLHYYVIWLLLSAVWFQFVFKYVCFAENISCSLARSASIQQVQFQASNHHRTNLCNLIISIEQSFSQEMNKK